MGVFVSVSKAGCGGECMSNRKNITVHRTDLCDDDDDGVVVEETSSTSDCKTFYPQSEEEGRRSDTPTTDSQPTCQQSVRDRRRTDRFTKNNKACCLLEKEGMNGEYTPMDTTKVKWKPFTSAKTFLKIETVRINSS